MKKFTFTAFALFTFIASAQTFVSTTPENKNVILVGNKKINTQENELFQTSIFPTKKTYDDEKVPNFKGKSLREALKISNSIGLKLEPSNLNGRVVWQSIKPGTKVIKEQVCKIKLSI